MTDLALAQKNLAGHSICLCKDGAYITDDGKGISPMMKWIGEGRDLRGYSAADLIVGKAAAMLFVRAGIAAVHGNVMSEPARRCLEEHGIPCTWDTLTENIINRAGTGLCPMEQTVAGLDDPSAAYTALAARLRQMKQNSPF